MRGTIARATALMLVVAYGLLLPGCGDKTSTPENRAQTIQRQALIQKHKDQQDQ
jgi:hypothetical protein